MIRLHHFLFINSVHESRFDSLLADLKTYLHFVSLHYLFVSPSAVVCEGFGDAGLVTALLSVLTSTDQELLLHAARAISRMSYDSCE